MSILSDTAILAARERGEIVIEPFDPDCLGGNSYDVHLSPYLATYVRRWDLTIPGVRVRMARDCAVPGMIEEHYIGPKGFEMEPGRLYLGSTVEYTETHAHVPNLDGRSSTGRDGLSIHVTAGRGDVGFCNHWTLELTVVEPLRIYAGMRIGQLTYQTVEGVVGRRYATKSNTSYGRAPRNPKPQPSRLWCQAAEWKR